MSNYDRVNSYYFVAIIYADITWNIMFLELIHEICETVVFPRLGPHIGKIAINPFEQIN